jgi:hypothetical protein
MTMIYDGASVLPSLIVALPCRSSIYLTYLIARCVPIYQTLGCVCGHSTMDPIIRQYLQLTDAHLYALTAEIFLYGKASFRFLQY